MNVFFLPSRPINHVFVEFVLTVMKRPTLRTVVEIVNTWGIARTVTLSELSLHHPCYYQCRANMTTSHCQLLTVKIQLHISGLQKVILIFPNHKMTLVVRVELDLILGLSLKVVNFLMEILHTIVPILLSARGMTLLTLLLAPAAIMMSFAKEMGSGKFIQVVHIHFTLDRRLDLNQTLS